MTDAAFLELLAGFEAALDASNRSLKIAEIFVDAHRRGERYLIPCCTRTT